jgi:serine protease
MLKARRAAAAAAALCLAACSKSSSSGPPSISSGPPPPTFSVSGTIHALAATAADGDTNDPGAPKVDNDSAATAQALPGTVTVGGWVHEVNDPEDWYQASLSAGQVVTLQIADWTSGGPNDLDLCLYAIANAAVPLTCSRGTGPTESAQVAAAGTYLVQVIAVAGSSRYVLTLAEAPLSVAAVDTLRPEAEFVPGEVLVRFKDAPSPAETALAARAESLGLLPLGGDEGRETRLALGSGPDRVRAFARLGVREPERNVWAEALDPLHRAKADTIALLKALRLRPDVASADPNYVFHPALVPNDTHWSIQWDFPTINLPAAWDVTTGTPATGNVIAAVVDTGVFLAHPDLAGKLVPGYDFISSISMSNDGDGIDPNPDDPGDSAIIENASFHGTHVAGTVGAATNDALGVAGVSWGAKIMPVRVLGIGGGTSFDIIQGIRFAAGLSNDSGTVPAQRADVINLSLGCTGCFSTTEQNAYGAVRGAGVVVVAAAGNDGKNVLSYPAAYAGVISVSAVGPSKNLAGYSNFGSTIDIAAPGGDSADTSNPALPAPKNEIPSTWVDASGGTRVAAYAYLQGTSMATPHVAGVVALMKAVCPTLTPDQVDSFLVAGGMTDDLGAAGRDNLYGWGLVNARKAVNTALTQCAVPSLGVTPAYLELAPPAALATFATSAVGVGTLTGAVTGSDDASWLTLMPPLGNGIGTWTATANRTGLAPGAYSATITLSAPFASGTVVTHIPVTLQVGGTTGAAGDAGYLHIRLLDAASHVVAEVAMSGTSGQYAYAFDGLAPGSYSVVAGTELDGGGVLCGRGDACGAYPAQGAPTLLDVSSDQTGIDFSVGFDVALGAADAPPPAKAGDP